MVADASALMEQGRFDEASAMLHPVLEVDSPDPAAVALHDRVDAAGERNDALLGRLARERTAKQWTAAIATIGQLEQQRPLSPDLVKLRTRARTAARTARTIAQARALMADGKYTAAATLIDKALGKGKNAQLQAMREQLAAKRAAPSTVTGGGASHGGGHTGAPAAGGQTGSSGTSTSARPPANVGPGTMPPRPDAPNPVTSGAGVTAPVSGGGAGAAAAHAAMDMPCLTKAARHGDEVHAC